MSEVKIVKVKVKDENLRKTYGEYMHQAMDKAIQGQVKGIWEIVPTELTTAERVFTPEDQFPWPSEAYLKRDSFSRRGHSGQALTYAKVWGQPKGVKK